MMEWMELGLRLSSILILLGALVFVLGIVWRVEGELDVAYTWLTLSVIAFLTSELIELLPIFSTLAWGGMMLGGTRLLAALTLFLGMYYMRDLVRRMDGEKTE